MRILHIADFGKYGNLNGVGEAVLHLAKSQKQIGVNVIVAYTRPNPYIKNPICVFADKKQIFKRLINEYKPDIAVFHSFYDFKHPRFASILKNKHIPYLITFHGGASRTNYLRKRLVKAIANELIFKPYIRSAAATIYLNEGERRSSIFMQLDSHKSMILPNGISKPNKTHSFKPDENIVISFISRLDYHGKGIDILLKAISSIEDELLKLKVKFAFYGYDYKDGTVEQINSTSNICEYLGYVSSIEKENAFLGTDIVILPSRSEGMPVSILEALSYGIPCIVTPQTNVADIIEKYNCGWVANLTVTEIASAILRAAEELNDNCNMLKDNAIRASSDYLWEVIAQNSIGLYEKII